MKEQRKLFKYVSLTTFGSNGERDKLKKASNRQIFQGSLSVSFVKCCKREVKKIMTTTAKKHQSEMNIKVFKLH